MVSLGGTAVQTAQAAPVGQMIAGFPVSPLTSATLLAAGLCQLELGAHQRFTILFLYAASPSTASMNAWRRYWTGSRWRRQAFRRRRSWRWSSTKIPASPCVYAYSPPPPSANKKGSHFGASFIGGLCRVWTKSRVYYCPLNCRILQLSD